MKDLIDLSYGQGGGAGRVTGIFANMAGCNHEGSSRKSMSQEEMVQYLENLKVKIENSHREEREYHDRQHQETRLLIRSVYDELTQQNERLRQRVDNLEQKRPN